MVIVLHWPTILVSLQQDMHVAKRFLFDRFDLFGRKVTAAVILISPLNQQLC